ncbi:trace amine-associated receptor 7d-like [Branchiostoma floridae]|uniref:Trace amine-associated receptor 7d-like n=1 Tax=Branchiostoma floridae TaxID=7739 RepID=A0A9J7LEV8_BRAFL|nr:trace amine-associated receptor 7d-like [Branchiostoma floridae]
MDMWNESFTSNETAPVLSRSPAEPAFIITVAVLAIAGNLLVVVVTCRRQTFPSASRLFIASMACSDLLLGSTFPAMVAPAEAGQWVFSDTAAQASAVIVMSSMGITYSALAGLNLDRYYALMNSGEGISRKKAWIFLISAWVGIYAWYIFSTVYGVPVYYDPVMAMATYDLKAHPPAAAVFYISVNGPGVASQNSTPQQQQPAPQNYNSDRSLAKIVLILTIVQTAITLPCFCAMLARLLGYDLPTFLFWSVWVSTANTFLDVVVYSLCQQSFRTAMAETMMFVASSLYNVYRSRNRVHVDQQNIEMSTL